MGQFLRAYMAQTKRQTIAVVTLLANVRKAYDANKFSLHSVLIEAYSSRSI